MNYKKCHNAIIENAKSQNCFELLEIIKEAEKLHLKFVFAYHKIFLPMLPNDPIKEMDYIEIVSEKLVNKYNTPVSIIKTDKGVTVTFHDIPNTIKLDPHMLKGFYKEIESIYKMAGILEKFELKNLPTI